jgi:tetratricopeptide (TPR) repeat protein
VLDLHPLRPADSSAFLTRLVGVDRVAGAGWELGRIAELCGHLPLALAIVARRLVAQPGLRPGDVVAELSGEGDRLDALASADPDGDAIRTVFSWSYQALKPEPAHTFRLLGLYPGDGVSVGAVAALNGNSVTETGRLLEALANSHLLDWAGRGRYRIHDLLHLYTRKLVDEEATSSEHAAAIRRLFDWYLYTASNATHVLQPNQIARQFPLGPPPEGCQPVDFADPQVAAGWVTTEADSLISVVRYAVELGYDEYVWKIVAAVSTVVPLGPQIGDWIELKELALAAARRENNLHAQMWLTNTLGYAYMYAGRLDEAADCFDSGLPYWSTVGADRPAARLMEAVTLSGLAYVYRAKGELEKALECCYRVLPVVRDENDQISEVWILAIMGMLYRDQGRIAEAAALLREALDKRPASGWPQRLLDQNLFIFLGQLEQSLGRSEQAAVYLNQALTLARALGNSLGEVRVLHLLQQVYQDLGQVDEAEVSARLAVDLMERFDISPAAVQE